VVKIQLKNMNCSYCGSDSLRYLSDGIYFCQPCNHYEDEDKPNPSLDPVKLAKIKEKAKAFRDKSTEPEFFQDMDYGDYIRNIEIQDNLRRRKKNI
jgi:hypothetical protein